MKSPRVHRTSSLRSRLNLILMAALLVFAGMTSLVASWILTDRLERLARNHVMAAAEQLAQSSTFAFLVSNPTPARQALQGSLNLPGARYTAFLGTNGSPIATIGDPPSWSPTPASLSQRISASGVHKSEYDLWHIIAPVRTSASSGVEPDASTPRELVGFVHLVWASSLLSTATVFVFGTNFIVALLLALLVSVSARMALNRLTRPLGDLAGTMRQASQHEGDLTAVAVTGPSELRDMAIAFNGLLQTINAQKRHLESEVRARTQALEAALAEAKAAANIKSEFLALISHDMRTPLYSIAGYTQLARNELPRSNETLASDVLVESIEHLQDYLGLIEQGSEELLQSINRLLDFSKLEAGKVDLALKPTDLTALVRRIADKLEFLCTQRNNELEVSTRVGAVVHTDAEKLEHILSELLTNACKFTENGAIQICATAKDHDIQLVVEDTGVGIPESQLAVIFEPFRQGRSQSDGRRPGTGLGLAIVKQFCELLGGEVQVTSVVGEGSRFDVRIPLPYERSSR